MEVESFGDDIKFTPAHSELGAELVIGQQRDPLAVGLSALLWLKASVRRELQWLVLESQGLVGVRTCRD